MKRLLTLIAATSAIATINAQTVDFTTETTPALGTVYSWSWQSDGSSVILNELSLHEAAYALPFNTEVRIGWCGVLGNRVDPMTSVEGTVFGFQAYAKVPVSLDGLYFKADLHALMGDKGKPFIGFGLGMAYQF